MASTLSQSSQNHRSDMKCHRLTRVTPYFKLILGRDNGYVERYLQLQPLG